MQLLDGTLPTTVQVPGAGQRICSGAMPTVVKGADDHDHHHHQDDFLQKEKETSPLSRLDLRWLSLESECDSAFDGFSVDDGSASGGYSAFRSQVSLDSATSGDSAMEQRLEELQGGREGFDLEEGGTGWCPSLIVKPTTPYRVLWDMGSMVLVVLDAIFIPIQVSFDVDVLGEGWLFFAMC